MAVLFMDEECLSSGIDKTYDYNLFVNSFYSSETTGFTSMSSRFFNQVWWKYLLSQHWLLINFDYFDWFSLIYYLIWLIGL